MTIATPSGRPVSGIIRSKQSITNPSKNQKNNKKIIFIKSFIYIFSKFPGKAAKAIEQQKNIELNSIIFSYSDFSKLRRSSHPSNQPKNELFRLLIIRSNFNQNFQFILNFLPLRTKLLISRVRVLKFRFKLDFEDFMLKYEHVFFSAAPSLIYTPLKLYIVRVSQSSFQYQKLTSCPRLGAAGLTNFFRSLA